MKMPSKEVYFLGGPPDKLNCGRGGLQGPPQREYYFWKHIDLFSDGTYVLVLKVSHLSHFMFFDPETIKKGAAKWHKVK